MGELYREIASRISTEALQAENIPTRALVVFNPTDQAIHGRVRFAASFPMRRDTCPLPVTVRDNSGQVLPSRLTVSDVSDRTDLPPGRVLWTMELEFVVGEVPVQGWRTVAAIFGYSSESRSDDAALFDILPLFSVPVIETECHAGDLTLIGTMDRLQ